MATSLQRQLAALATPSTSILAVERKRSSILFNPKDAASYDRETFYQIGLDGLRELSEINPKLFNPYFDSMIFDNDSKLLERAVMDKETNSMLDDVIENFLICISPYMTLKAPLKCMEWLVYRFHIEKFNVEAIARCILPYYDTKTFALVVKVLEVERFQSNQQWLWLVPSIKLGIPLTRKDLFGNRNAAFISWVFEGLERFLKVHEGNLDSTSTFVGFFTSLMLGVLNICNGDKKQNNTKVILKLMWKKILKLLLKIQKKTVEVNNNVRSSIFMILTMIVMVHKDHPDLAIAVPGSRVMYLVLETCPLELYRQAVLLVNFMCTFSDWEGLELSKKARENVVSCVMDVSAEFDVLPILRLMLKSRAVSHPNKTTETWDTLSKVKIDVEQRANLIKELSYAHVFKTNGKPTNDAMAWEFIARFEREYPVEFGIACKNDEAFVRSVTCLNATNLSSMSSHAESEIRKQAVIESYNLARIKLSKMQGKCSPKEDSEADTDNAATTSGNAEASSQSAKKAWELDSNLCAKQIMARFEDHDPAVLSQLIQPKTKFLMRVFSLETLINGLTGIIHRNVDKACTRLALKRLCHINQHLQMNESHETLKAKIFGAVYQYLFPSSSTELLLLKAVSRSKLVTTDALFNVFADKLTDDNLTCKQVCKLSFEMLSESDGRISNMTHWLTMYETKRRAAYGIFVALSVEDNASVSSVLKQVEQGTVKILTSKYPVTSENISKVLRTSEKMKKIPLELVLTKIERLNLAGDKDLQQRIFNLAIDLAERPEHREISVKFLRQFLQTNFPRSAQLLEFWTHLMLNRNAGGEASFEYRLIRTLQFLRTIFVKLSSTSVASNDLPTISEVEAMESQSPDDDTSPRSVRGLSETRTPGSTRRAASETRETLPLTPRRSLRSASQTILPVISNLPLPSRKRARNDSFGDNESLSSKNSRSEGDPSKYREEATSLFLTLLTQCVRHESEFVRHWGLECIKILLNWKHLESVWVDFINYLLLHKSELESDKKQLNKVTVKLFSGKGQTKLQKRLLDVATSAFEKDAIRLGVLELMAGTDSALIFETLLPQIKAEMDQNSVTPMLNALLHTYDGSLKHLPVLQQCISKKDTCKIILSKFTCVFFEKLPVTSKRLLFAMLIDVSAKCEDAEVKVAIQRSVRKWDLDTEIVSVELEACLQMQKQQCPGSAKPETKVTKSAAQLSDYRRDESLDWVSRCESVLEFAQSGKRLLNKTKLIAVLFKLLKICISMEEQSPIEYLKQLILTALTVACEYEGEGDFKKHMSDWIHFQVDIVIDCLRCSRNPQTHHHALILLNYAAKLFPEQVLHGVMSLFTFMGNSILRQDDSYSTQLIQQTVSTIIPTLAVSGGVTNYSRNRVSAGIYKVFTAAVQDIPTHRRVPIFSSLVKVLDPQESMWQVSLIIIDNALSASNKRAALKSDMELAESVVWSFDPQIVLETVVKIYAYLLDLPVYDKFKAEDFAALQATQNATSKSIIDLSRKQNLKEVQLVINFTLDLATKLIAKFVAVDTKELNFNQLLEKCLLYSKALTPLSEDKTFRAIASRNFEALEKINDVLNPKEFISSVMFILGSSDVSVKKKLLDMLNQRLLSKLEWFDDMQNLVGLVDPLLTSLKQQIESEDAVQFVQTVFLTLKLLARNLASRNPENFIPVFDISYEHARSKNALLAASALLCLSELFCLKSLIIPKLAEITTAILKSFKRLPKFQSDDVSTEDDVDREQEPQRIEDMQSSSLVVTGHLLLLSGMTTFIKFIETLGLFAGSSFLSKAMVSLLSIKSDYFGDGEKADNRKKAFDTKLRHTVKTLAAKISLRALLMPLRKSFVKLSSRHEESLPLLMKLLKDSLLGTEKQEYTSLLPSVQEAFVLEFLDYRRARIETNMLSDSNEDSTKADRIEDDIIDCLVNGVILKLSEAAFRPFYHRIFDWAGDNLHRRITFYRLSFRTAERLKSLFVNFAGYVIDGATKSLDTDTQLTKAVLQYLYQVFLNDREGFITPERFNNLVMPVLDLIETAEVTSGKIDIADVNAAVMQLALATNDLNRWQHLIELLSIKAQNENPQVRLYVVALVESVAKELEKDFLPLLPPAVPFIAELLGDDDEAVEAATKKMLVKLESIVGEPLQPYFSS